MFEKMREHRRVISFFAFVYLIFGASLFYLLLFTPGLEFSQEETEEGSLAVFIGNNSVHIINGIDIERQTGETVLEIERLLPGEKIQLDFSEESGAVSILAKAQYHNTVGADFSVTAPGEKVPRISYQVIIPTLALVGTPFNAEIEACNDGEEIVEGLEFEQSHDAEFFEEKESVQMLSLAVGDCEKLEFLLTPIKKGTTKIYFKVKAQSYSKTFDRQIEITEFGDVRIVID